MTNNNDYVVYNRFIMRRDDLMRALSFQPELMDDCDPDAEFNAQGAAPMDIDEPTAHVSPSHRGHAPPNQYTHVPPAIPLHLQQEFLQYSSRFFIV